MIQAYLNDPFPNHGMRPGGRVRIAVCQVRRPSSDPFWEPKPKGFERGFCSVVVGEWVG